MISDNNIREAIGELFKTEESFTAFDVTLKLQEVGFDYKHKQIKQAIHDMMDVMLTEPPYYHFEKTNVRKNGMSFFVYHDQSVDPYDVKISQNPNTSGPGGAPYLPSQGFKAAVKSQKKPRKKKTDLYDNRGRYTIPTKIVKEFYGNEIYVVVGVRGDGTGYIEITDDPMSDGKLYRKCEQVFRLPKTLFTKAFGKQPAALDVTHVPQVAGGFSSVIITAK